MTMGRFDRHATGRSGFHLERQFLCLAEQAPDAAWRCIVENGWPGWRDWYVSRGGSSGSAAGRSLRAVRRYMPEMESLLDKLVGDHPEGDLLHQFLSFWCPPRYLVACTQLASIDHDGPFLIRNYDLDPALNEAIMLRSRWHARPVLGMVEGLSGMSDGINAEGLAVSLSFGGRINSGTGFGIPMIVRYLLETCSDVQQAIEALRFIPTHMSYNLTLVDAAGALATVMVSPDRPAIVLRRPWATNHQIGVEWPWHARFSGTMERAELLSELSSTEPPTAEQCKAMFHREPIYSRDYSEGYGTVFTSLYRPNAGTAEISWPNGVSKTRSLRDQGSAEITVSYSSNDSSAALKDAQP
ncbi:MAG: hypothetical protein HKN42_15210 [Granulosicoccus sp.]|nr:hypothetical protein [Granulosicoccus sp.]